MSLVAVSLSAVEECALSLAPERERFGRLVGGPPMRSLFARLARAAATNASVLLAGETGTGKELTAEALHTEGARSEKPFVVVDCSAIPPELIESELFGHERGAFTGAHTARAGAFEVADGGTIFLDELGELRSDLQPKLLRVLEMRRVKRVGGTEYRPVDVRVITATNRDLRAEVAAGRFRSDLYYRVAVVEIRLPPLREHAVDLPILVDDILEQLGRSNTLEAALLRTSSARAEIASYPWPGNVRELRNYVERCLALGERPPLGDRDSARDEPAVDVVDFRSARRGWNAGFERQYLVELLLRHHGNVSAAARAAGLDRKHLYRLLWRHGLR